MRSSPGAIGRRWTDQDIDDLKRMASTIPHRRLPN
jgi:hypothetical protein